MLSTVIIIKYTQKNPSTVITRYYIPSIIMVYEWGHEEQY